MKNTKSLYACASLLMLALSSTTAAADSKNDAGDFSYPRVNSIGMMTEFQFKNTYDSDDADSEVTTGYNYTELYPDIQLSENFSVTGALVFEPIQDGDPGDDVFFDNEGLFIEEIKLNYQNGAFGAFAGKFNPGFGIAWDYGRGIWGEDFAEDYEITEKIGFGGSYAFETP